MARKEFKLPDIGEGVVEGEVVTWHVEVGARFEDDSIVDIMTDKSNCNNPISLLRCSCCPAWRNWRYGCGWRGFSRIRLRRGPCRSAPSPEEKELDVEETPDAPETLEVPEEIPKATQVVVPASEKVTAPSGPVLASPAVRRRKRIRVDLAAPGVLGQEDVFKVRPRCLLSNRRNYARCAQKSL